MASMEKDLKDDEKSNDSRRPKNVPLRLWEKFQALEKRTNEVTKRSTEKRIKHLQKTALDNVARALHHPEDKELLTIPPATDIETTDAAALASSSTCNSVPGGRSRKRPAEQELSVTESQDHKDSTSTVMPSTTEKEEKEWQEVRGLLGINSHLAGVSHGSLGPKTVLELQIDDAVSKGDYQKAEELSDHMASREFGEKVAQAIDAKNFLQHKQKEEEMVKAKRKRKLHWGFEAKHRWETKSNM